MLLKEIIQIKQIFNYIGIRWSVYTTIFKTMLRIFSTLQATRIGLFVGHIQLQKLILNELHDIFYLGYEITFH